MGLGCCCETVVPGRGLSCARSVFSVGKVVRRAFPIAAVVEMQVSISQADLCGVTAGPLPTLELARAEVLVVCCCS